MIIKCPECGRQVSEKAPTCPSCGVEIAGKITRCNHCGEVYFTEDGICPACQETNSKPVTESYRPIATPPRPVTPPVAEQSVPTIGDKPSQYVHQNDVRSHVTPSAEKAATVNSPKEPVPAKKNYTTIIIAAIFAIIVCGALFYFYNRAQSDKEGEDYEFAMRSSDPEILQSYLLRYSDAPTEHRDSIQAHLLLLQKGDEEWQNAVLSNSRSALQQYLDKNPDTVHRQEALNKIDSLDWITASKSDSQETVEDYIKQHADGRYIDDAKQLLAKIIRSTVQPTEKEMITGLFRQFFQSVNSRDESRLLSTVGMVLDTFLGKSNATTDDVITFMNRIYKDDITNLNWHIDTQSYKINKTEVAENEYEYTVTFNARKEVDKNGEQSAESYRINATVSTEGKISAFNLTKIN